MATIPTPTAPVTPAPAPTRTSAPAPVPPTTTLSPVTRRRPARTAPPARMAYVRHATAGDSDDRIVNPAWDTFKTAMVWIGGALFLLVFGGLMFTVGVIGAYRSHPSTGVSTPTPQVISQQPAPTPAPVVQPTPVRPPAPGWQSRGFPTRDDCEYHFVVVLHEASAGRCQ